MPLVALGQDKHAYMMDDPTLEVSYTCVKDTVSAHVCRLSKACSVWHAGLWN